MYHIKIQDALNKRLRGSETYQPICAFLRWQNCRVTRTFALKNFRSQERKFYVWNFRSQGRKRHGTVVPERENVVELSLSVREPTYYVATVLGIVEWSLFCHIDLLLIALPVPETTGS